MSDGQPLTFYDCTFVYSTELEKTIDEKEPLAVLERKKVSGWQ